MGQVLKDEWALRPVLGWTKEDIGCDHAKLVQKMLFMLRKIVQISVPYEIF